MFESGEQILWFDLNRSDTPKLWNVGIERDEPSPNRATTNRECHGFLTIRRARHVRVKGAFGSQLSRRRNSALGLAFKIFCGSGIRYKGTPDYVRTANPRNSRPG